MCERDGRDDHGRFRPGASGNPDGRPVRKPYLRLLQAAEACGATVTIQVPTRTSPRHAAPADDLPPRAA